MALFETLEESKQYLRDNWKQGVDCPCCNQRVQLYDYKLFSSSALALIVLYRLSKQDINQPYFHAREFAYGVNGEGRATHYTDMKFWGLIEKMPNDDPKKKSSGFWRITDQGRLFVEGKIKVPSRILVFNNKFYGYTDKSELISIRDALGNHFDYSELMGEPTVDLPPPAAVKRVQKEPLETLPGQESLL